MQIEWSEEEVLKLAGVGTGAEAEVVGSVGRRIDGGKRWDTGWEVGIRSGAGRTGAERGEPCGVFELWGVAPTRGNLPVGQRDQSMIGNGDTVSVATEILEHGGVKIFV
jgi:hypothetical protein